MAQSNVPSNTFQQLAVDKTTYLGLQWGCFGVTTLLVAFLAYVRFTVFRRYFADDALVLRAYILLFAGVIMWQVEAQSLYDVFQVVTGAHYPPSTNFFSTFRDDTQSAFASWVADSVRALGHNVKGQKWLWWSISQVCSTQAAADYIEVSQETQVGADVATDALILLLPFHILWNVQIGMRNKLYLAGIFSLTLFTMIVAIIRVELTFAKEREDGSNLYTWSTRELAVSIIIACLASYRSLFNKLNVQSRKYNKQYSPSWPGSSASGKHTQKPSGHCAFVEAGNNGSFAPIRDEDDTPLRNIRVRRDLEREETPV